MMSKRVLDGSQEDGTVSYVAGKQAGRRGGLREEQDEWLTMLPEDL